LPTEGGRSDGRATVWGLVGRPNNFCGLRVGERRCRLQGWCVGSLFGSGAWISCPRYCFALVSKSYWTLGPCMPTVMILCQRLSASQPGSNCGGSLLSSSEPLGMTKDDMPFPLFRSLGSCRNAEGITAAEDINAAGDEGRRVVVMVSKPGFERGGTLACPTLRWHRRVRYSAL